MKHKNMDLNNVELVRRVGEWYNERLKQVELYNAATVTLVMEEMDVIAKDVTYNQTRPPSVPN
jgi:hypothetical protein